MDGVSLAGAVVPAVPPLPVVLLVDVARDSDGRWHRVQDGEDADADHQLLQLVGFGAGLLPDHFADAEQRHESGQEEGCPQEEVRAQREDDEPPQVVDVLVADGADPGDRIPVHRPHGQYGDGLAGGHQPRRQVEVLRVSGDGLVAPLEPGRQQPGEGEDDPPERGRHPEEVDQQEDDGACWRAARRVVPDDLPVAGDCLVAEAQPHQVSDGNHEVATGQENYGTLRVSEPRGIDEECQDSHTSWNAAYDGPQTYPKGRKCLFVLVEECSAAGSGAV